MIYGTKYMYCNIFIVEMSGLSSFYLTDHSNQCHSKKDQLSSKWIGKIFSVFPYIWGWVCRNPTAIKITMYCCPVKRWIDKKHWNILIKWWRIMINLKFSYPFDSTNSKCYLYLITIYSLNVFAFRWSTLLISEDLCA